MAVRNSILALAVAAAVLGHLAAPAAAAPPGTLEIGGRVGLMFSSMNGEAVDASATRTSTRTGPAAAFLVRWLRGPWSVEGELGMSDRGATLEEPLRDDAVALHLYYMDLPLLGVYELSVGGALRPRLEAGLMVSVLAARTDPVPGAPVMVDERLDIALVLGAGLAWPYDGGTILVDLRYLGGARDLSSAESAGGDLEARGQALSMSVGYGF